MPSESAHIQVANDNQETLRLLMSDVDRHLPWVGTVAFYKGLHIVEAVLAVKFTFHGTTHQIRNQFLSSHRTLNEISKHYLPLYWMSQKARYFSQCKDTDRVVCFSDHITRNAMVSTYLSHHLHRLEKSAQGFLTSKHLTSIGELLSGQVVPPKHHMSSVSTDARNAAQTASKETSF